MGLLNGELAKAFAGVFSAVYLEGTLYRSGTWVDDGQGGGAGTGFSSGEAVKVQIDQVTDAMRASELYVDGDVRILMLAHGVATPDTDAEISAGGTRYMVESIATDPCGSYYELRGRRKANA